MVWRGASSPKDRFFACLPYVLPLIEVGVFGTFLFENIPILATIYFTLMAPFLAIYRLLGLLIPIRFLGLVIFFALLLLVVRNERIRHFIRYNTMQAILLSICVSLCSVILQLFGFVGTGLGTSLPLFGMVFFNLIFLAVVSAAVYSIFQCIRGKYAEIPVVSDAVYAQVR